MRTCPESNYATYNWREHNQLIEYITSLGATSIGSFSESDFGGRNTLGGVSGYTSGLIKNPAAMSSFAQSSLGRVALGDYMFIDSSGKPGSGNDDHGYIVVGFGEPASCHCVIGGGGKGCSSNWNDENHRFNLESSSSSGKVPYIVDYSYGKGGWHQDPRPRPFYCSKFDSADYENSGNGRFTKQAYIAFLSSHKWYFYHMPDGNIYIPCERQYRLANSIIPIAS